ncbi:hypothetical protein QTH97_30770 [Variovorax sp. J22R24]|uniref:hypothetical protein n=1 Tax=Variovorax gracilis TaxID=3053502 RepID=UPI002576F3F8|nr:hypothetical protein [Variovorax sp. J22R24]MDM0109347.1 hypothetical protein [Variovorax sp. J22R24]
MASEIRQHKEALELRRRLLEAEASGDDSRRKILADLRRIEVRELTERQRADQAAYIAQQCADA